MKAQIQESNRNKKKTRKEEKKEKREKGNLRRKEERHEKIKLPKTSFRIKLVCLTLTTKNKHKPNHSRN